MTTIAKRIKNVRENTYRAWNEAWADAWAESWRNRLSFSYLSLTPRVTGHGIARKVMRVPDSSLEFGDQRLMWGDAPMRWGRGRDQLVARII